MNAKEKSADSGERRKHERIKKGFPIDYSLLDEFAMSQAMMSNVDVFVARDDAERAQAVLTEAREAGRLAEDTEES